jgi:hypothetical protein
MTVSPDFIVLHADDNVATALRTVPAGAVARVAGTRGALPDLEPVCEIPLGHKAALRPIAVGELVVKHGHPIGRATAGVAAGEHVHVHNVVSLSRETDLLDADEGEAYG